MSEDRLDEIARRAGTALRRPAPEDGLANVRSSHRRRRTGRVAAGGAAVALAAVGAFMVIDRGADDDGTVVTESTTVATTTISPTTTTTTTPVPAVASGWQRADGAFPQLAFAACCGLNWEEGEPSPSVPADPDEPLPPGMYNVRSVFDDQAVDDYADGVLALELRPYTRCTELVEFGCFDPPFADNELGVPNTAARTIEVALDDSVRVGLHGFRCVDGQLELETWFGTGADLATLTSELGAAYETAVAAPLRAGVSPEQVAADLAANRTAGFFDPGCPGSTDFAWTSPGGPTVVAPLYLSSQNPSISAPRILPPEGLAVDEQGVMTIYVFAGFRS